MTGRPKGGEHKRKQCAEHALPELLDILMYIEDEPRSVNQMAEEFNYSQSGIYVKIKNLLEIGWAKYVGEKQIGRGTKTKFYRSTKSVVVHDITNEIEMIE